MKKLLVQLSDGKEILKRTIVREDEFRGLQDRAREATAGNLTWEVVPGDFVEETDCIGWENPNRTEWYADIYCLDCCPCQGNVYPVNPDDIEEDLECCECGKQVCTVSADG